MIEEIPELLSDALVDILYSNDRNPRSVTDTVNDKGNRVFLGLNGKKKRYAIITKDGRFIVMENKGNRNEFYHEVTHADDDKIWRIAEFLVGLR